jgi:putative membrane protein
MSPAGLFGVSSRRSRSTATLALIAVPLLIAGLLAWAFGHGLSHQGSAVAAVVNDDTPVTINGQLVPLGRQLAGKLVDGSDERYRWVLTNDADARRGLASGAYAAAVTVPPTFSARATSAATASDPLTAEQGMITVTTAREASLADEVLSKDVADATVAALNQQVVQTYLDRVYVGFTTVHDAIGQAADGASRLADGTTQLRTGSRQLADGGSTLVVGLGDLSSGAGRAWAGARQVASGAGRLRSGTADLASGAGRLAAGAGQLVSGGRQLSAGLDQLRTGTAQLPAQTRRLADGAQQVAEGNRRLADEIVPYADTAIRFIDRIPELAPQARKLQQLAVTCSGVLHDVAADAAASTTAPAAASAAASAAAAAFCAQLQDTAGDLVDGAVTFDNGRSRLRGQIVQLRTGLVQLADGSQQVADGADRLADSAPALTSGIAGAASGGRQLTAGLVTADAGAEQLASGTRQVAAGAATLSGAADGLATGVGQLASGSARAQQGAVTLTGGADRLASGAAEADRGAGLLASGLSSARDAVPSYTPAGRQHLAKVAATPAVARAAGDRGTARLVAGFFLVLALWVGALVTFLTLRSIPADALASREATWRLVVRGAAPGLGVAVAGGSLVGAAAALWLGTGAPRGAALTAVAVVVAVTFTVLHQALVAALGRAGWVLSLLVLLVTVAAGVVSTVPPGMKQLAAWLPTRDALAVLRAVAVGGDGLVADLFGLGVWLLAASVVTLYLTERQRVVSPHLLHPPHLLNPAGGGPRGVGR